MESEDTRDGQSIKLISVPLPHWERTSASGSDVAGTLFSETPCTPDRVDPHARSGRWEHLGAPSPLPALRLITGIPPT